MIRSDRDFLPHHLLGYTKAIVSQQQWLHDRKGKFRKAVMSHLLRLEQKIRREGRKEGRGKISSKMQWKI